MQAWAIEQFGPPSVFQPMDLPLPEITPGQVLIRVAATSVNPIDVKIRSGAVPAIAPAFPAVLHGDVAGIIEAIGEGVDQFTLGDEVYACAGGVARMGGALAEFMIADAKLVAPKPASLTMREAAALPLVSITAWEGLVDRAKVRAGHKVLVYGATGGVGHVALQLAKWSGAWVCAMVSSDKKEAIARQLGADVTINYRETPIEEIVESQTRGEGFDIVFDTVGNDNLQNAFKAATLNGTVVSLVSRSQQDLSLLHAKGLTLHLIFMLIPLLHNINRAYHGEVLKQVAALVDAGHLRPLLDETSFTFADVANAHARLESGQAIGKVTLAQPF
jgi:NADPH2:quinone reductase